MVYSRMLIEENELIVRMRMIHELIRTVWVHIHIILVTYYGLYINSERQFNPTSFDYLIVVTPFRKPKCNRFTTITTIWRMTKGYLRPKI